MRARSVAVLVTIALLLPIAARAVTLRFEGSVESFLDEPGYFASAAEPGATVLVELSFDPFAAPIATRPDGFGGEIVDFAAAFTLEIGGGRLLSDVAASATGARVYGGGVTPLEWVSFSVGSLLGALPSGAPVAATLNLSTTIPVSDAIRLPGSAPSPALFFVLATVFDATYCGTPAPVFGGCDNQRPVVAVSSTLAGVPEPGVGFLAATALTLLATPLRRARALAARVARVLRDARASSTRATSPCSPSFAVSLLDANRQPHPRHRYPQEVQPHFPA